MKIKEFIKKNINIFSYLFFGICTTIINVVVFWLMAHCLNWETLPSTIIAWLVAVLFAYITDRKWVFHSKDNGIIKEMVSFFTCRLATGVVDWVIMIVFVDIIALNDILIKIISNLLVIIINYTASKYVIFRKK